MKPEDVASYCPVMNIPCPQGEEKAYECRMRYSNDSDPIRNIRDFDILCCSYQRKTDGKNISREG